MALVVEDGTGKTDAESYISVADATTYFENHGTDGDWSGTDDEKEDSLREATQYVDSAFAKRWQGYRANETQRLAWPRANVIDLDEYAIDDDTIPRNLKEATCELALAHITGTALFTSQETVSSGGLKLERVKAGPVEREREWFGSVSVAAQINQFPKVEALLAPFLKRFTQIKRA